MTYKNSKHGLALLAIANAELAFQNAEKAKRAEELAIANKELAFQNDEKAKRAEELAFANIELAFQNAEKDKRAAELAIANKELAFQNAEKDKRAAELTIANQELAFQNAEKIKRAAELNNIAFYDPLTGLPNRRLLLDRLNHALVGRERKGSQGALVFIDLDGFKNINDTHGHACGDLVLQQAAQRLESCLRKGDTVARLGGDEFVLILEDLCQKTTETGLIVNALGEKILAMLGQPYQLGRHKYCTTASIGVVFFNHRNGSAENLLKQADIAMYQAKQAGRNTLRFFNQKMHDDIKLHSKMTAELHTAIETCQFDLYYQVQMDSSNRALGAEVLLRWMHPERGLVLPATFIPLAEKTGLILPLGQWVLETACAQLGAWQLNSVTRHLTLAVNVSALQFQEHNFVAQVQAALQRHSIPANLLKLEFTESLLHENIDFTIGAMNALNAVGVLFSLDDFGTGYSSLQYLKRLPLDQFKIDQSFVSDIASDPSANSIVKTIVAMAHNLNIEVIAEGVETEAQRQLLIEDGCTLFQGYLFSKPIPIDQFEALVFKGL